jgi:hypothetical protein
MLIIGDTSQWEPWGGQTGLRNLRPELFAEFRKRGIIRHHEDGSGLHWYFETRQTQAMAFAAAGLRIAEESSGDFMRENKARRKAISDSVWADQRARLVKSGVDWKLEQLYRDDRKKTLKKFVALRQAGLA